MLFFLVPIIGIAIVIGCMFVVNGAVSRREHKAKEVLSSYDDIISCYCDLILQNDSYYSKLYAESLSKMCDERRCCIGAFEYADAGSLSLGEPCVNERQLYMLIERSSLPKQCFLEHLNWKTEQL